MLFFSGEINRFSEPFDQRMPTMTAQVFLCFIGGCANGARYVGVRCVGQSYDGIGSVKMKDFVAFSIGIDVLLQTCLAAVHLFADALAVGLFNRQIDRVFQVGLFQRGFDGGLIVRGCDHINLFYGSAVGGINQFEGNTRNGKGNQQNKD